MKILVVCINYAPEMISTGLYATGFAEYLADDGVDVDVITAVPYYPAWRRFDGWKCCWTSRVSENGARIVHCPLYVPSNPTGAKRILHYVSFAVTSLPVLLWKVVKQRPDVVVLIAPSLINAPGVLTAARLIRARTWLHVQDFEVEAAFATGLLSEATSVGRTAKSFETWALKRFDRVSSISGPMLAKLAEKGVAETGIVEFRNWANLKAIQKLDTVPALKVELGITTKHVALYSGNIANKQGLEVIPKAAQRLAHRDDLTIAICGDGPMRATLEGMSANLPMIRFFPLQPIDRLNELLSMADVHLLPQIAEAADLVLPSKVANMQASGRPIIATTELNTALGREIDGVGVLTPPGDDMALAEALEVLLDAPNVRAEMGTAARARALLHWDMDEILSRIKVQLEALITPKRP